MAEILFGDENDDDHISIIDPLKRIIWHIYLRDWNVEPMDHSFFNGKIIKKESQRILCLYLVQKRLI